MRGPEKGSCDETALSLYPTETPERCTPGAPVTAVGRASTLLRTHPQPLGLAAGTVSVTAAFLSSSSFSYPENYGQRKGNQGAE